MIVGSCLVELVTSGSILIVVDGFFLDKSKKIHLQDINV